MLVSSTLPPHKSPERIHIKRNEISVMHLMQMFAVGMQEARHMLLARQFQQQS